MTLSPLRIDAQESVDAARNLMIQQKVGVLPVFDDGKLCGVIQIYDC
jgi:CBS domain-containing protein